MMIPCLNRPCRSPLACSTFGFCRELNLTALTVTAPAPPEQRQVDALAGATVDTDIPVLLDGKPGRIVDYENSFDGSFAIIELEGGVMKSIRLPDGGRIVRPEKIGPE